jgi:hypothetical protein
MKGEYYLIDLGIDGMIILSLILKKQDARLWTGLFDSVEDHVVGSCEHTTDLLSYLDQLMVEVLKKDSVPRGHFIKIYTQ